MSSLCPWVFLLALPLAVLWFFLRTKRNRRRFAAGRTPMSDDAYLQANQVPLERAWIVLAVRKAVALQCRVPPEMIHGDESQGYVNHYLFFDGFDPVLFMLYLEEQTGGRIADEPLAQLPLFSGSDALRIWIAETADVLWRRLE